MRSFGCHVSVCVRRPGGAEPGLVCRATSARGRQQPQAYSRDAGARCRQVTQGDSEGDRHASTVTASQDSKRRQAHHLQDHFSRETTCAREDAGDKLVIETEKPLVEKPYLDLPLLPLLFELQSSLQLPQRCSVYGVLRVLELDDLVKHGSELV